MSRRDLGYAAGQAEEYVPELASVDDLQVAAAAAAAAMGEPSSTDSDSSDSSDESSSGASSDDDMESDSEESSSSGGTDEGAFVTEGVNVVLTIDEADGSIKLQLEPHFRLSSHGDLGELPMVAPDSDNEILFTSSEEESEDEDSEDDEILEIHEYDDLRRVVDAMEADVEDVDGGGGAGPLAAEELFGGAPLPALEIEILPEDAISLAGTVLSVIEGTIVVRAAGGSRALNEGSFLVLEDRTMIGAVEDIFGPVQAPLYALRYNPGGGGGTNAALPAELAPEAKVYSVDKLAQFVAEESLRVKGYDGDLAEETEGANAADLEQQFSDDEAEAMYKRKLKAKRKGERAERGDGAGGSKPSRQKGPSGGRSRGGGGRGGGRGAGGGNAPTQSYQPPPPTQSYPYPQGYAPQHQGQFMGNAFPGGMVPPQQQQQQQYHPGPPQYLGQYYAQGAMPQQYYPPQGQFQAHATAGQLGAMSLQRHHVMGFGGAPAGPGGMGRGRGGQGGPRPPQPPPPPGQPN